MDTLTDLVDPAMFREAMSRLVAPVHVVTTSGEGGACGLTASAVTSVSDRPPIVLVCVNRKSLTNAAFKLNGSFCINTLDGTQQGLAEAFAGRTGLTMPERFALGSWVTLATGAPVLESARASFDCRLTEVIEQGSHSVLFGLVEAVRVGPHDSALVYLDRSYHRV
ncbi:flavin reductase family protein [Kaistia defluvii]|uniref:flavin reductase family protein n=1 Tax=Kaistia defluvii TaxID=410841 RepID=UPI00224EB516|nr:flavin reductase family protein [Kaistia defluvii]MCX5516834.1 flavin reductase family protein [Kaistia defluvii]